MTLFNDKVAKEKTIVILNEMTSFIVIIVF